MSKKGLPYRKDTGFKVPENYFHDFEHRVMSTLPSSGERSVLPVTSSPYKVPDSYFDHFETRLNQKLNVNQSEPKVIPLFNRKQISYWAGVAAVLVVILSSVLLNRPQAFGYSDLDIIAVENYLLESIEFTSPEETHLLKEGDFSFATSPSQDIDREAVLEYLNENLEDPSLLLNEQ